MKCSQKLPNGTVCGSESHFRAQCPHNTEKGGGKGSGASGFGACVEAGPIGDIIGTWTGMVLPDGDEHDLQDAHSVPSGSAASTDERPRGQWARDAPTAAAMPQPPFPYRPGRSRSPIRFEPYGWQAQEPTPQPPPLNQWGTTFFPIAQPDEHVLSPNRASSIERNYAAPWNFEQSTVNPTPPEPAALESVNEPLYGDLGALLAWRQNIVERTLYQAEPRTNERFGTESARQEFHNRTGNVPMLDSFQQNIQAPRGLQKL